MEISQRVFMIAIVLALLTVAVGCSPAPTPVPPTVPQPTATNPATASPVDFVWKITSGSSQHALPNSFNGLALDQQGNLYVEDSQNSQIVKFDSNGKLLLEWGSQGEADGQFNFPPDDYASVAVDAQGNVYVTDATNARIQKFDSNGKFLTKWGKPGTGDEEFTRPVGVAVDKEDNVYVVDDQAMRLQKFDKHRLRRARQCVCCRP